MIIKPKVSVCMITYGHEKYILQAIEGVLMQQCDFEVELILANDCSPDSTDQVIQDILTNHPRSSWIKYFKHQQNLGMIPNFIYALKKCEGKYVALCDGDDYWTDPLKLQKQVDFLEVNTEFVIHSGAAKLLKDNVVTEDLLGYESNEKEFEKTDFYTQNNLVTCTVLFRNCNNNFPKGYQKVVFGDWFLYVHLLNKANAKAYRSTEVFSVYRIHDIGFMDSLSELKNIETHIQQIILMHSYLQIGFSIEVKNILDKYFLKKYRIEIAGGQFYEGLKTFANHIKYRNITVHFRKYISALKWKLCEYYKREN